MGNTPAGLQVTLGEHVIAVKKADYVSWERKINALPGHANLSPELQPIANKTGKQ